MILKVSIISFKVVEILCNKNFPCTPLRVPHAQNNAPYCLTTNPSAAVLLIHEMDWFAENKGWFARKFAGRFAGRFVGGLQGGLWVVCGVVGRLCILKYVM